MELFEGFVFVASVGIRIPSGSNEISYLGIFFAVGRVAKHLEHVVDRIELQGFLGVIFGAIVDRGDCAEQRGYRQLALTVDLCEEDVAVASLEFDPAPR